MNSDRQLMKARLGDLKEKKEVIRKEALNTCRMIRPLINPSLAEVIDMDVASAATAMDRLVMQQAELLTLNTKIAQLEEALYD